MNRSKTEIRSDIISKRSELDDLEVEKLSMEICRRVLEVPEVSSVESIAIYLSHRKEVMAQLLLAPLIERGVTVFVPIMRNDEMSFSRIGSLDELKDGAHGISEPIKIDETDADRIRIFIVPGITFDKSGHRIGWGKGTYDKLFAKNIGSFRIGLCYDFQVVDAIPQEEHDEMVDMVITETRVIRP